MNNVDYEFYKCRYNGGSISYEEWPEYETRAMAILYRYKRIYTVTVPQEEPDGEKLAVCAMAEALYNFDLIANGEGGTVQSASIGSVSSSFGTSGADAVDVSPAGQAKELYRCASLYLDIYRGVG